MPITMRPAVIPALVAAVALLLEACQGSRLPTTSSPVPSPPSVIAAAAAGAVPPDPAPVREPAVFTGTVSGVVRVGGVPVAGATVTLVADGVFVKEARSTTSDALGHYEIPAVKAIAPGPLLSAYRPGYFTEAHWSPGVGDQKVDFDLSPLSFIQLGNVIRSTAPNGVCEGVGYRRAPCHRFAFVAPVTGTLVVTLYAAAFRGDIDVWGPRGASAVYVACPCDSPFPIRLNVEKGETYEVRATVTSAIGIEVGRSR